MGRNNNLNLALYLVGEDCFSLRVTTIELRFDDFFNGS